MRIGIDARMIGSSGIGKVIENIAYRMVINNIDWQIYLIIKKEDSKKFIWLKKKNITIVYCEAPIYSIREQLELLYKIPSGLDFFWSPHYNIPILYFGKIVVTIHDLAHLALPEINKGLLKKYYAKLMLYFATRKATRIVCVSQFTIDELNKYIHGVKQDKIIKIYNGIDDEWRHILDTVSLIKKKYLVYVGNVKPHKNLKLLLHAFNNISDKTDYDLVIIGKRKGFITGELNFNDEIKGIEDRVHFTGYINDDQLRAYVKNSDGLVFPSLYEGFGLPPLEALAAGKKVLCSNIPVLKEICGDNVMYTSPYLLEKFKVDLLYFINEYIIPCDAGKTADKYRWEYSYNLFVEMLIMNK